MAECVRRAWLTYGGRSLPLEDVDAGYVCSQLDLGWPEVREVTSNNPDADGIDDSQTQYFGSRAVSANIVALESLGGEPVDDLASRFGWYMRPAIRPELHYVLERSGAAERVLVVRAAGYSWPIDGTSKRDVHLAWIASDPYALDAATKTATAWSGSSTSPGRTYNLTYNPARLYPPGGGAKVDAELVNDGDAPVAPVLKIYGPITAPAVEVVSWDTEQQVTGDYWLRFEQSFVIGSGEYVEVDCARHTAHLDGDPARPVTASLIWLSSAWPVIAPAPEQNSLALTGDSTAGVTQVEAAWRDRYLT